ncbi:MAG TPA: (d)CMP kinase [Planctomycetaceae bacterium]|nr:(d)CMP kinase [Planctomycetaceae bacterium]
MIITIDGPAGAGKSTIAKQLAATLGYDYLDTGSMYRAVALFGLRRGTDWEKPDELAGMARSVSIDIREGKTLLDGDDVSDAVRSSEVTQLTRFAANNPAIREIMVAQQRRIAAAMDVAGRGVVTEGRDQGTVVFPESPCKIFLTATPGERARRRIEEMRRRGETGDFDDVLQKINDRDAADSAREIGPLRRPDDAELVMTDGLSIAEVLECLQSVVSRKIREKTAKKNVGAI